MLASLIGDFAGIWSKLGSDARIDLLSWLGRQKTVLPPEAVSLDTILVGEKKGEWVRPDNIIAPRWASLAPPNLSAARIPHTRGIPKEVLRLWDEWCGIRDLDAVVESVVRATCNLPRDTWPSASEHFADWLDRLVEQHGEQAVAGAYGTERGCSPVEESTSNSTNLRTFWITRALRCCRISSG